MADVANLQVVIGADTSDAEKGIASLGKSVGGLGSTIATAFGTAAIAGVAAFGAAVGVSIKQAADFEKTISAVGAVSGATTAELKQLSDLALQLGKDTSFSATEAAQGIEELTKAGVSMADIMGGAAKASLDLAAAGGVSVADAATIASTAMNVFNKTGADMGHIADLIAGAANASAIDVNDFKFSLAAAGSVAATVGLSFDDLSTAIAEMGAAGLKGSDMGTSFKTLMLQLQPTTEAATEKMKELGIITAKGANQFFDASGKIKSLAEVQQVLQTALKGQTEQQKLATLQTLFGTDAIRAAAIMAKNGAEGANAMAEAMGKVSASAVGAERLNNLAGSMEKLQGSLSTVAITIGLALLPTLRKLVDGATDIVNAWLPAINTFADGLPAAIDQTITTLGEVGTAAAAAFATFVGIETADITNPWDQVHDAIGLVVGDLQASLAPALTWLSTTGWPLLQAAMSTVATYITTIYVPLLSALWDWLSPKLGAALTWLTTTGLPMLTGAIQVAGDWLQTQYIPTLAILWDWLSTRLGAALTWLTTTAWPAIQTAMTTVWSWITGSLFPTLSTLWDWLSPKLSAALNWLTETGWPALGNAANAVQNWIKETLSPTLETLWTWLAPKLKAALDWLKETGWPALQTAMTTVWKWIEDPLIPTLSTVYDWLAPKFQYAVNWLVITGWPAMQTAMSTVWSWIEDNLIPTLSTVYDWLAPKFQYAVNWLVITGWPALKNAGIELWHTLEDLNTHLGNVYEQMTKRGVFVEMKGAWDDLVKVGDKLWREILAPLVGALQNTTDATGDATDSSDDFVGSLLGVVQAVRVAITWLDHLVDYMILSVDGWKALGQAAQWAAAAAGKAVTGGDIPEFPSLTRRPTWLDQSPGDLPSGTRHRGTAPSTSPVGGGGNSPAPSPSPAPVAPTPTPPAPAPTPAPIPAPTGEPTGQALIEAIDAMGAGMGGVDFGHAAAAIAKSEGADGDLTRPGAGGARGPFQFDPGGELNAYASYLGMSKSAAGDYAGTHPMEAATWALNGYLGGALRAGMGKGLRGWTLANYGSRYGQRPQGSEIDDPNNPGAFWARAGRYHLSMFGYARGGWVGLHGPEMAMLGERGPEYVVSNRDLRNGGGGHSTMTLNVAIGGRIAEQIVVEGYEIAVRRGRLAGAAN